MQAVLEAFRSVTAHEPRWTQKHLDDMSKLVIEFNEPSRPVQITAWNLGSVEVTTLDQATRDPVTEHVEFSDTDQAAQFVCQAISIQSKAAT